METFENARDNRKMSQALLAEALHLTVGRSGMNTEEKLIHMQAALERVVASQEFLEKAVVLLEAQATSEVPEVTDEELQKLLEPAETSDPE